MRVLEMKKNKVLLLGLLCLLRALGMHLSRTVQRSQDQVCLDVTRDSGSPYAAFGWNSEARFGDENT